MGLLMSRGRVRGWVALSMILVLVSASTCFMTLNRQVYGANSYNPELFGIGEPLMSRSIWENGTFSLESAFNAIGFLNVTRLRETSWMSLFLESETALNATGEQALDMVISNMTAINVTVMGMSQDFPNWMTRIYTTPYDSQVVPYRNVTIGSNYMNFLQRYNESWQTLASSFPNITMWEIGNEYNADPFLHPQGYNRTTGSPNFTDAEKVEITTDLLYYGSSGIHHGNPNATTVLGGLSPGSNLSEIADFLEMIYGRIESGQWPHPSENTSDYFQVACWHPYLFTGEPNETSWVEPNNVIHDIMVDHGDGSKRVVFSEFGYNDNDNSQEDVANYLEKAFLLARDSFQWLDTIYWFRLVEPDPNTTSTENPAGFGLFDLNWTRKSAATAYRNIPEFPLFLILPLFMIATLLAVIVYRKKYAKTSGSP